MIRRDAGGGSKKINKTTNTKNSEFAFDRRGSMDHRASNYDGASICPTVQVKVDTLRKDEVNLKIINKKRADKTNGIPDGKGNIQINNEKVSVLSKARREIIEKEITKKGGVIMPVDDDVPYVIVDPSISLKTLKNWKLALNKEENNKTHIIPYELYKYFSGETKEIEYDKKENDILYFVSRHYLLYGSCWDKDDFNINKIDNYLKQHIDNVLFNIGEFEDFNYFKRYLKYLENNNLLDFNKIILFDTNDVDIFKLYNTDIFKNDLAIKEKLHDYIINNHEKVFKSINAVNPTNLMTFFEWCFNNSIDITECLKDSSQYFFLEIIDYINKAKNSFSMFLEEFVITNIDLVYKKSYENDETKYKRIKTFDKYMLNIKCQRLINWTVENKHIEKMNYSLLDDFIIYDIFMHYLNINESIPKKLNDYIFDNVYIVLSKIGYLNESDILNWFLEKYTKTSIKEDNIYSWLPKTFSFYLEHKDNKELSKRPFIQSLSILYIKYKDYCFIHAYDKYSFYSYIKKVSPSTNFNINNYDKNDIVLIIKDYLFTWNKYDRKFREICDNWVINNAYFLFLTVANGSYGEHVIKALINYLYYLEKTGKLITNNDKYYIPRLFVPKEIFNSSTMHTIIKVFKGIYNNEEIKEIEEIYGLNNLK